VTAAIELAANEGWCAECGSTVRTVAPIALAAAIAVALADLYALLDAGQIHAAETADGQLQICLQSLPPTLHALARGAPP